MSQSDFNPRFIKWPYFDSRQTDGMKVYLIEFTDDWPRIESYRIWNAVIKSVPNNGRKPTDWGPSADNCRFQIIVDECVKLEN